MEEPDTETEGALSTEDFAAEDLPVPMPEDAVPSLPAGEEAGAAEARVEPEEIQNGAPAAEEIPAVSPFSPSFSAPFSGGDQAQAVQQQPKKQ